MRISDWSSDACSSDLTGKRRKGDGRTITPESACAGFPHPKHVGMFMQMANRLMTAGNKQTVGGAHTGAGQVGTRQVTMPCHPQYPPPVDRKSTRLNSSHSCASRMPSSA